MTRADAVVVVPNWNGRDLITTCLESLLAQSADLSIVVVDNGSTDGSPQLVRRAFPSVHVIELAENAGFTGGVNAGIEHAMQGGADHVLLFNNDAIAEPTWAEELIAAAARLPDAGIITGKLMQLDRRHLDSTGDFLTTWGLPYARGRNEIDKGQYDSSTEVFGASGGASLYRVAMLREIGVFDDDYFAYFEDVDLSFRAHLAGWRVLFHPAAVAYHHVGATSSSLGDFAQFHTAKNFFLLYLRNMPTRLALRYAPLFVLQAVTMAAGSLVHGRPLVFVRAWWAAVRLLPRTMRRRREIQSKTKVDLGSIDRILTHHRPRRPPQLINETHLQSPHGPA